MGSLLLDQRLSGLMRAAQAGDRRAYQELLVEVTALLRTFVRRRVRPEDCEDVVQETLLSIHRNRHTYDPRREFRPWMYAIARHRLIDAVRKQRRRRETAIADDAGFDNLRSPETVAEPRSLPGFLHRALATLTQNQREVVHMLKLEDRSVAEVASRTGLSPTTVKVTAHRAYQKLRKLIPRAARDE